MATRMMTRYVRALVTTGLYGDSESEVASRLVAMSIERLIQEKMIERKEPEPDDTDDEGGGA